MSAVHIERFLVRLVSDAVANHAAEHHLSAIHEVEHYVLKYWLKSILVNQVEVDFVIGCDLDTLVSFNEVEEASELKSAELSPPFLSGEFIYRFLEEQNLTAAPSY